MADVDRREALVQAFEQAAIVVEEVRSEQLNLPTPCPSFDIGALIDHLVGAGQRALDIARGQLDDNGEFPHIELTEAADRLRAIGTEARLAWSDDRLLSEQIVMPWGETYSGATLVDMYLAELATHAWDLAVAIDLHDSLDDNLFELALNAAHAMLKPEYRNVAGPGSPYGDQIPVAADAPIRDRLAGFMGRDPASPLG